MNNNNYIDQERFDRFSQWVKEDDKYVYVGTLLKRAAQKYGESPVLFYQDTTISYIELYHKAAAFARVLKERGVIRADRVVLCFENSAEFYIAYFAIWQAGAVVVPVNTFLRQTELGHIISDSQPKLIITSHDRIELFSNFDGIKLTEKDMPTDAASLQAAQHDEPLCLDIYEVAALLYTSGTTGVPKGVMISSHAIIANVLQSIARLRLESGVGERIFAVLPLFHVFAQSTCVWAPLVVGCAVIVVPKIDRRMILHNLKYEPTIFLGVPALYGLLCLLKTAPLESVRLFISGGDALPDKIRSAFSLLYRRKICSGYGMTETGPVISVELEDKAEPTGCVGIPLIGVKCAIKDEAGNELPINTIGEINVKGAGIMLGYYHEPEQTARILHDGWLNTGDLGYLDAQGKLVITGRIKDLIKNKGFNIYPQELENIILMHSNVLRVGVVGQPDEPNGEVPIAFVQVRVEQDTIEQELKKLCTQHLAMYKIPKSFICSKDELPITATGKVDKKVLRKKLAEGNAKKTS